MIILSVILVWNHEKTRYISYIQWKKATYLKKHRQYEAANNLYEKMYSSLQANGEFLFQYGQSLYLANEYEEAVSILEQAKHRTTDLYLYTSLGSSFQALKQYNKAEENFLFASALNPYRFYPRYLLVKLYEETGNVEQAVIVAEEILHKKIKVPSPAIIEIKQRMKDLIERQGSK